MLLLLFFIQIRKLSKNLLLQLASQDALARLKASKLGEDSELIEHAFDVYFLKQKHVSFIEFLKHYLDFQNSAKYCVLEKEGVLLQVCAITVNFSASFFYLLRTIICSLF